MFVIISVYFICVLNVYWFGCMMKILYDKVTSGVWVMRVEGEGIENQKVKSV